MRFGRESKIYGDPINIVALLRAEFTSASHLAGEIDEVQSNHVVSIFWLQVRGLGGSMFEGTRNEASLEPACARPDEVVVVGGHHHDLSGGQTEDFNVAQVLLGRRLVSARDLGAEDCVPRNPSTLGHVENQRDVAV